MRQASSRIVLRYYRASKLRMKLVRVAGVEPAWTCAQDMWVAATLFCRADLRRKYSRMGASDLRGTPQFWRSDDERRGTDREKTANVGKLGQNESPSGVVCRFIASACSFSKCGRTRFKHLAQSLLPGRVSVRSRSSRPRVVPGRVDLLLAVCRD